MVQMLRPGIQTRPGSILRTTNRDTRRSIGGQWQTLRAQVLRRDHGLCRLCRARGHLIVARDVDHIRPSWAGGTDAPGNLQSLCADCHRVKTTAEAAARATGAEWPWPGAQVGQAAIPASIGTEGTSSTLTRPARQASGL